jgi:hypothetical protein
MSKRAIVTALVGVNLFLLAALTMSAYSPPTAFAQRIGAAGSYIAVTCRADKDYDAIYVLSLSDRKLHCFVPDRTRSGSVSYGQSRDLKQDFDRVK